MAKTTWEDVPGFDQTTGKYIRLDGDKWLTDHSIRESGRKRGKKGLPGSEDTQPDEFHLKIENWVRKRALACEEDVRKYIERGLRTLHDLRASWDRENPEIDLDALRVQSCKNIEDKADEMVGGLDRQRGLYEEATRDLQRFRREHKLSRVAHYPSSQITHWLWIPVFGIVESFVSANLLGSVSRGGVIEGWMVALVLTAANILFGVLAGWAWRYTRVSRWITRLFAYAGGLTMFAGAMVWNIVAGHVRDIYVYAENTGALETTDEALATAYQRMIESPLPWESLPSAGLAMVGVFVFCLTMYKMYSADDPYPGYGDRHRKVEKMHADYQEDLQDALQAFESVRSAANAAIGEIKGRYEMDLAVWEGELDELKKIVETYPANLRQYNKDLEYLLGAYRSANLESRNTPPPSFFSINPTIDEAVIEPPEYPIPSRPEWGDVQGRVKAAFEQVEKTYDEHRSRFRMLDKVSDDYTEEAS